MAECAHTEESFVVVGHQLVCEACTKGSSAATEVDRLQAALARAQADKRWEDVDVLRVALQAARHSNWQARSPLAPHPEQGAAPLLQLVR